MQDILEKLRSTTCHRAVFLVGFFLCFVGYYPGLMTQDSEFQLLQARGFNFTDWHPVITALIWSFTDLLFPGPSGILLLFLTMYWIGFYLISTLFRSYVGFVLSTCLPFSPFLINFSGTIWKDVLVFNCFLVVLAVVLRYKVRQLALPFAMKILLLVVLVVGILARQNSLLAAVPLFSFLVWPVAPVKNVVRNLMVRGVISTAVVTLLFVTSNAALETTLRPRHTHPEGALFLFDMTGISKNAQANVIPGERSADLNRKLFDECYQPRSWDFIWLRCDSVVKDLTTSGVWNELYLPWARAIQTYPSAYIQHRLNFVLSFFNNVDAGLIFVSSPTRTTIELGFNNNIIFRTIKTFVLTAATSFPFHLLFSNGFWLALSASLLLLNFLAYLRDTESNYIPLFLTGSAVLYIWPLTLIGSAQDFRYMYWGVGACCICLVELADRLSLRSADRRRNAGAARELNYPPLKNAEEADYQS